MATPRRTLRSSTSSAQPSAPSNTSTTTPTAAPTTSSTAPGANFKVKTLAEIKAEKQKGKQNNGAAKSGTVTLDTSTPAPTVSDVVVTAKPASQPLQPLSTGAASLASKKQMLMEARARKEAERLKAEPPTDAAVAVDSTNASRLSADAKPFIPQTDNANSDTAMDVSVSDDVSSVVPMSEHQLSPLPPSTKSATTNDFETKNAQKPPVPLRKRKAVELSSSGASSSASSTSSNSATLTTSVALPLQSTMPIPSPSSQATNGDHNTSSLPAVSSSPPSLPPTSVPVRPKKKLRRDFSATNVLEMKIPIKNESEDEVVNNERPLQLPTANELDAAPSDVDLSSSEEKHAFDVEMMHDDIASTDADYVVAAPAPIDFSALDAEIEKFEAEFGVTQSDTINVNGKSDFDWNEIDREIDELQNKIDNQQDE